MVSVLLPWPLLNTTLLTFLHCVAAHDWHCHVISRQISSTESWKKRSTLSNLCISESLGQCGS
jgi:hypothetical protein